MHYNFVMAALILPHWGRGTMRSMVEGARRASALKAHHLGHS